MRRNQLLAGIMTAMAAVMPAVNVYVDTAAASEILTSDETVQNETNIDKTTALQNSVKMTDKISAEDSGKNIMFSPTSLNVALGMIAEKKDPRKTRVLLCINKMTASYCGSGMLLFIPEFLTLHFRLSIWGIRHPSDFEPVIFGLSDWDIYIVGFGGRCSFIQRYLKIHCYLCNGIT